MGKITAHLKNILGVTTFYTGNMYLCHKTKYTMEKKEIKLQMKESMFFTKYGEMIEFLLK